MVCWSIYTEIMVCHENMDAVRIWSLSICMKISEYPTPPPPGVWVSNLTLNWCYIIWKKRLQNGLKYILRDIDYKKILDPPPNPPLSYSPPLTACATRFKPLAWSAPPPPPPPRKQPLLVQPCVEQWPISLLGSFYTEMWRKTLVTVYNILFDRQWRSRWSPFNQTDNVVCW